MAKVILGPRVELIVNVSNLPRKNHTFSKDTPAFSSSFSLETTLASWIGELQNFS